MIALVVDDEEKDRLIIGKALRRRFQPVIEAESYSEAMAVFDQYRGAVQLLVADIALPDGNGCSLALAIQKQNSDLRVLFISGQVGSEISKYYGLDVVGLHFLKKPFRSAQFLERVEAVMNADEKFPPLYFPKALTSSG